MKAVIANLNRELRAYFFSPLAYVVLTLYACWHQRLCLLA